MLPTGMQRHSDGYPFEQLPPAFETEDDDVVEQGHVDALEYVRQSSYQIRTPIPAHGSRQKRHTRTWYSNCTRTQSQA